MSSSSAMRERLLSNNSEDSAVTVMAVSPQQRLVNQFQMNYQDVVRNLSAADKKLAVRRIKASINNNISRMIPLGILAVGIWHLVYSETSFYGAVDKYDNTLVDIYGANHTVIGNTGKTCGDDHPLLFPGKHGCCYHKPNFDDSWLTQQACVEGINLVLKYWLNNPECYDTINNLCDGPGMWDGYMPIIIIFGLITPFVLAVATCIMTSRKKCQEYGEKDQEELTAEEYLRFLDQPSSIGEGGANRFKAMLENCLDLQTQVQDYITQLSDDDVTRIEDFKPEYRSLAFHHLAEIKSELNKMTHPLVIKSDQKAIEGKQSTNRYSIAQTISSSSIALSINNSDAPVETQSGSRRPSVSYGVEEI